MNETRRIVLISVGIFTALGLGFYLWVWPQFQPPEDVVPQRVAEAARLEVGSEPAVAAQAEALPEHYPPLVSSPAAAPLPALGESDAPFAALLDALIDPAQRAKTLVAEQLIRRIVATIDSLPRERLASNNRAFKRVPGDVLVSSRDGSLSLNPANESRYLPLLSLFQTVSAEAAAKPYRDYYPLFDQAYRDLGNPGRNFNDRLVQVIDHLLATPEVEGPIPLVQPKVLYEFADPALAARSAGQKMLIRMGPVNQAQLKKWLREFRALAIAGG